MMPCRTAYSTSSAVLAMPSFSRMFVRCVLTVFTLISISAPMSVSDMPLSIISMIWCSRTVRRWCGGRSSRPCCWPSTSGAAHRQRGRAGADRGQHVQPIAAFEVDVQQHEVEAAPADLLQGVGAVARLAGHADVALVQQQALQPRSEDRVVVHDEQLDHDLEQRCGQ